MSMFTESKSESSLSTDGIYSSSVPIIRFGDESRLPEPKNRRPDPQFRIVFEMTVPIRVTDRSSAATQFSKILSDTVVNSDDAANRRDRILSSEYVRPP